MVQLIGLGMAAVGVRSKWREHARPWDRFTPQWMRRLVGRRRPVQVESREPTIDAAFDGAPIAVRGFNDTLPVEERLSALEFEADQAQRNLQHHIHSTNDAVRQLTARMADQRHEIMTAVEKAQSQGRVEIVTDLRLAGWGLVVALVGVAVQLCSTTVG